MHSYEKFKCEPVAAGAARKRATKADVSAGAAAARCDGPQMRTVPSSDTLASIDGSAGFQCTQFTLFWWPSSTITGSSRDSCHTYTLQSASRAIHRSQVYSTHPSEQRTVHEKQILLYYCVTLAAARDELLIAAAEAARDHQPMLLAAAEAAHKRAVAHVPEMHALLQQVHERAPPARIHR